AGIAATQAALAPLLLAPLAWGVAGLGMGIAFSTNALVVLEAAPPGQEGSASSALQLANVLGVALGAGLGGAIIGGASTAAGVSQAGLLTQDAIMIGVALAGMLVARRLPSRAPQR
ncbi:MAG TPA: MFS transporter, partial [Kouleothrix sp.]|nr:MFS transporter [Kouleothrix sp.]